MSEGKFRLITTFRNISWQRNHVSKKTNYDKMSVITMPCFPFSKMDRKVASSQRFDYFLLKIIFFYNLLAVIYDKKFLTRIRIDGAHKGTLSVVIFLFRLYEIIFRLYKILSRLNEILSRFYEI